MHVTFSYYKNRKQPLFSLTGHAVVLFAKYGYSGLGGSFQWEPPEAVRWKICHRICIGTEEDSDMAQGRCPLGD